MGSKRPLRGYVVIRIEHTVDPSGRDVFTPVDVLWTTTSAPAPFVSPLQPGHVIAEVFINDETPLQTSHDMSAAIDVFVPIREKQRIVSLDIAFMTESVSIGGVSLADLARLGDTWFRGQVPADVLPMAEDDNEPEGSDPPYLLRSTSILARHGMTAEQMMTVDGRRVLTEREVVTSGPRWTFVGSAELHHTTPAAPFGGRTRDLAMSVADDGSWRCYLAAADGGVWFRGSTSLGWTALGDYARTRSPIDDANILSTGAVGARFGAAASGAQDIVVVGTGEPSGGDALSGVGLRVSEDGGRTWVLVDGAVGDPGLRGVSCYSVTPDPNQDGQFFIAASNGVWRLAKPGSDWVCSRFVPRPVPAAISAVGVGHTSPATDLVAYDDSGTTRLVIAFDLRANPANPVSTSNPAVPTAIRFDTAASPAPTALTGTFSGRMSLACTPDGGEVWALSDDGVVSRLRTGATSFVASANSPGNGSSGLWSGAGGGAYAQGIAVAKQGQDVVVIACGTARLSGGEWFGAIFRSTMRPTATGQTDFDHGTGFFDTDRFEGADTHADCHRVLIDQKQRAWVATDGGVYRSRSSVFGSTLDFADLNDGLATLQYNYFDHDDNDASHVVGGTQDNGIVQVGTTRTTSLKTGDGGGVAVQPGTQTAFAEYIHGKLNRRANGSAPMAYKGDDSDWPLQYGPHKRVWGFFGDTGAHPLGVAWNASGAYAFYNRLVRAVIGGKQSVLFGSRDLWHRTYDKDAWWTKVPVGATASRDQIIALAPVRSEVYLLTAKGSVHHIDFSGATPVRTAVAAGFTHSALNPYTSLVVVPGATRANDRLLAGRANPGWGNTAAPKTSMLEYDATSGVTTQIDLGSGIGVLCLEADLTDPLGPRVYAGTPVGVYAGREQQGVRWAFQPFWRDLPEASVLDLRFHAGSSILRAALHGRGVWEAAGGQSVLLEGNDAFGIFTRQWASDLGRRAPGMSLAGTPLAKLGEGPGDLHVIRHRWNPPLPPATTPPFTHGDKFAWKQTHPDIGVWHDKMVERGYRLSSGKSANKLQFTRESRKLARAFQTHYGLKVDGDVGPETWRRAHANPPTLAAIAVDQKLGGLRSDIDQTNGDHLADSLPNQGNTVVLQVNSRHATPADGVTGEATLIAAPSASAATLPDEWWVHAQEDIGQTSDWVAGTDWSFVGPQVPGRGRATTSAVLTEHHPVFLTWETHLAELVDATGNAIPVAVGDTFVLVAIVKAAADLDSHFSAWPRADKRDLNKVLAAHPRVVAVPVRITA